MLFRARIAQLGVATLLAMLLFHLPAHADESIPIGGRKQLFIDRRFVAAGEGIELVANPADKLGLVTDEQGAPLTGFISRIVGDGNRIRMQLGHDSISVLESEDGFRFRNTGISYNAGGFTTLLDDPRDPPRRFKLFGLRLSQPFHPETDGVYAKYSADGVNFTDAGRVFPYFTDNPTLVNWDERINKYVIYTRAFDYNSENQRRVGRIETDDPLQPWPYSSSDNQRLFPSLENIPVVLSADDEQDPHSDIYYNALTMYPEAQDVYLMFLAPFRHFTPDRQPFVRPRVPGQWEDFGLLEVQLAVSRDGIHWERPTREPYFSTGLADEWDRWYAVMAPGYARRGNYLYQYYNSSGRLHDSAFLRPEYEQSAQQMGGIGVVRQRLDGFVSLDADHHGGWFDTPLLTFAGSKLRLNINTGGMGTAFVEIRDADGRPIPGFTLADCEEVGGNFIDQTVHWRGSPDVSALAGQPVRLHVRLKRAKLFAFQFTSE
jgi:hypothetical protein